MSVLNELWTEKYRPKTIDETLLDENVKNILKQKIKENNLPHLLLVGEAGTGKTTLAKAIANELNAEVLELNASKDRGIDVIRNQVANFVKIKSRKPKIVFFDEADGLTQDAQQSLRNLMEQYSNNARFIFTANYEHQIIQPIKDRCFVIRFKRIPKEFFYQILNKIIDNEKIYVDSEKRDKIIEKIIENSYPSLRKAVEFLQSFSFDIEGYIEELELNSKNPKFREFLKSLKEKGFNYILIVPDDFTKDKTISSLNINLIAENIFKMIYDKENTPIYKIRKYLIDNQILNFNELYKKLFEIYLTKLEELDKENNKELREQYEQDLLLLSEYQYRDRQSIDKEINFFGFVLSVRNRQFPYVIAQFVKEKYQYANFQNLQNNSNIVEDRLNEEKEKSQNLQKEIIKEEEVKKNTITEENNNKKAQFEVSQPKRKKLLNIFTDEEENENNDLGIVRKRKILNTNSQIYENKEEQKPQVNKEKIKGLKSKLLKLKKMKEEIKNTNNEDNNNESSKIKDVLVENSINPESDLEELDKKLNSDENDLDLSIFENYDVE